VHVSDCGDEEGGVKAVDADGCERTPKTVTLKNRMSRFDLVVLKHENECLAVDVSDRPKTRGDCERAERPCPWVSCKYHVYIDVTRRGNLKLNFPGVEPEDLHLLQDTCALDVAQRGGLGQKQVGAVMNLTRGRVQQIESKTLKVLSL
jgi:hypothetical protein